MFVLDWVCASTISTPLRAIFRCQGRRLRSRKAFPIVVSFLLLTLVQNYDFPNNCEDYIHRIGRTGVSALYLRHRLAV